MFLSIELEIEANKLVREYLSFADYPSTLSSFDVECGLKGRGPAPAAEEGDAGAPNRDDERARTIEEMQNRFQLAFQDGNRDEFFGLWDANFPVELRQSDPMYQKMEFQLNIYFAVFPIHPFVSERAAKQYAVPATMEAFKVFLATRGADLCKTTQFLNYYALPYVPDPRVHPSFTDLFTERHIRDLQERLRGFLASALRAADAPFLLKLLTGHSGAHSRADKEAKDHLLEMKAMRQRVRDLEDSENVQSSKFRLFQNDYHNLISIASELVQTLAACINGERITTSYLTGVCQRLAAFKGSRKSSPSKVG
ncbi:LisH domain-containing protein armc9 [Irineochytrium annulatum]|nr:LisH domain-containing protein armc9 [Irineochytrium annulatum]